MNLVVRELPREHRAAGVLRRHVVPRWGWRGPIFLMAFTSASRTFAAPVFSCARRWIWRIQCLRQLPLQVVDDDVLEVVNVLVIGINSWRIHPLRETAVLSLGGVLQKARKRYQTKER
jgi:hypothetical protein